MIHRRYPRPGPWGSVALAHLRCTVLDCETTGLHPAEGDRLVSIGAVRVDSARVSETDLMTTLVNPGRSIPAAASAIHGITDDIVVDAPSPQEAVDVVRRFVGDSPVVGHLVAFDLAFLNPVARAVGVDGFPLALDTLLLSGVLWPHGERHNLTALSERLGVVATGRHTAIGDATTTARCFVAMLPLLESRGIVTVRQALRASHRTRLGRRFAGRYR